MVTSIVHHMARDRHSLVVVIGHGFLIFWIIVAGYGNSTVIPVLSLITDETREMAK